ncbi:MAG: HAMP domain-containing histidine kinase [Christensenellaceae bacterium]|nr:HAMP domain-containing histidine kinase [Christensenellaceae bacterium]
MFRFKTLFGRLMTTYILLSTVIIVLVGAFSGRTIRQNATMQAQVELLKSTQEIELLFKKEYSVGGTGQEVIHEIGLLAKYKDYGVWIGDRYQVAYVDVVGEEKLAAQSAALEETRSALMERVLAGETVSAVIYENDLAATPVVTAGVPLRLTAEQGSKVSGVVFLHTRINGLDAVLGGFYGQLFYTGIISMALAFALVFLSARRIERPLLALDTAAKKLGKGDFTQRLDPKKCNEMAGLAETFNRMAEELEKYENTRESFVANVSHELRSPLTSIQGFVQGMLDNTIEEKDREQYLQIVLSESQRLSALIRDMLDLAKFESGQFPLNRSEWDINELLRQCLIRFITKIEDKNLEVSVNIPDERELVDADQDRITQVVTNLIDNAVKFCDEGGTLKIWTYNSEGRVVVNIANTGSPIPEEDIPFVFDRFFKVDKSHNRRSPGTGIGLSIVKNIVIQHGEKIWVNSQEGTGTVFAFTLSHAAKTKGEKKARNGKDSIK